MPLVLLLAIAGLAVLSGGATTEALVQNPADLSAVIQRTSSYVTNYLRELGGIVGNETSVRKVQQIDKSTRERKFVADFRTTFAGDHWIGLRHFRVVDGIAVDPMFRGRLGDQFDLTTPEGRLQLHKAVLFENSRYFAGDQFAGTAIATFPLEVFRPENIGQFEFRRLGIRTVGGTSVWNISVRDRTRGSLAGQPLRGTALIDPSSGRVFSADIEFWPAQLQTPVAAVHVRYEWNAAVELLTPTVMDYSETANGYRAETHTVYDAFVRFRSDTRLGAPDKAEIPTAGELERRGAGEYSLSVDVPLVTLDAWVNGNNGPVTNLTSGDFVITENGIEQTVTHFAPVSTPYDVLLLFDRSTSTEKQTELMQQAAKTLIEGLRPDDRVGLADFDYSFHVLTRWTDNREQVLSKVARFPAISGGTRFYHAIVQSLLAELVPVSGRRRVLVVLSDGRDNRVEMATQRTGRPPAPEEDPFFSQMINVAMQEHIPIYIVALNTDRNLDIGEVGKDEYHKLKPELRNDYLVSVRVGLEKLAQSSGGRILFPRNIEEIVPLYKSIASEIGFAYSLGYTSNIPKQEHRFREIKVTTRDPKLSVVQSRLGYSPP